MKKIAELLDEAEFEYEEDNDGDFVIEMETEDGRTQVVFVAGEAEECGDTRVRQIWSAGCEDITKLNASVLRKCLAKNSSYSVGAWEIIEDRLNFCVKTVDNLRSSDLSSVIDYVAITADDFEKHFSQSDDL